MANFFHFIQRADDIGPELEKSRMEQTIARDTLGINPRSLVI